jgi:hypothetical protein
MVATNCSDEMLRPADLANEVAELPLLLPAWQLGALGQAAQAEGMTIAQLLRRMVNRTLAQRPLAEPDYYHG